MLDSSKHPFLRRWDQSNANKVTPQGVMTLATDNWIKLEDGIEVKFSIEVAGRVRRGDYWLIPARHVTGDVEWPKLTDDNGNISKDLENNPIPKALPPLGTLHYYAPLAIINENEDGNISVLSDCRCSFSPLSYSCQYSYFGRLGIGTDLLCPQNENNQ